ncbi:MAG: DUF3604 domain-containing protein [Deltaproteobacteria bacterium]|nr:DUF3604 domain-containing protein [Deltaproteobacteria bacterium]
MLGGAVEVERTAAFEPLIKTPLDDDFPAAALDSKGNEHIAWIRFVPARPGEARPMNFRTAPDDLSFLTAPPGGDQVRLRTIPTGGGTPKSPIPITEPGRDVYKVAVAVDAQDRVWVFWSERNEGQFDVWARPVVDGKASDPVRISQAPGNDVSPVATTDAAGRVWVAWQGVREGVFRILARRQLRDGDFGEETVVSTSDRSSWAPAIAASRRTEADPGRVAIVWDGYDKGDYDVWLRELDLEGRPSAPKAVANGPEYEARATAAYDHEGRLWISWEWSGPTWGKDYGTLDYADGIPLLKDRRIGLIVLAPDGTWLEPEESVEKVMPRGRKNAPLPLPSTDEPISEAMEAARPLLRQPFHNVSRLAVDRAGRPWLLFRSRAVDVSSTVGTTWLEWAAYYEGGHWTGPILVPNSDNLLYSVPAVVSPPDGGIGLVWASDNRQRRISRKAAEAPLGLDVALALTDPWDNDLYVGHLSAAGQPEAPRLRPASSPPAESVAPSAATLAERAAIVRSRAARIRLRGETMQLLRGEFHRHTELSSDGGADGPLEDMWRYAIDVAALDWVGNGDHDNGHNREYPWWMIQKTTDAFHIPGTFTTVFSYERSLPYPEGHRNVIFAERGVRPLPRLPLSDEKNPAPAPDTLLLYRYLHEFGGISAPHTSATRMGTDWRNNDPAVEPFVEIYQGSRNSYEMPGAPREPAGVFLNGLRKEGFVSNALAKGYRLGFIASSDHHSTHISYAMVWAKEPTRASLLEAMRARRVYAATDDIIAELWAGPEDEAHFMGEEFSTDEAPALRLRFEGTAPFDEVAIVKDGAVVKRFAPGKAVVEESWTDPDPKPDQASVYYVRGHQDNDELVWTSPVWVTWTENE